MPYQKLRDLFLQQSYIDSWEDYQRSLRKTSFIKWDYVVLTASNDEQAATYQEHIEYRLDIGLLPKQTKYVVLPDPEGKRVGSGGATFNVLKYIAQHENCDAQLFKDKRILVIHSGGDSKRVPQYSATGKLFSPVPHELPNGRASTLFDEFIIAMSGFPSRIREGMLVLSGDVLLLFNPLQVDFPNVGSAAISIKQPVETGKNHGVFLNDGEDNVAQFLHKHSEERLAQLGAVNDKGYVDLDTGAVLLSTQLLNALYSLISTDYKIDEDKFDEFVNEQARISFYGDFLYPLAKESTLENYYKEAAEGTINDALLACRAKIWETLSTFSMKLLCLSPAEFIHFGTTRELLEMMTQKVEQYNFLDWKKQVATNAPFSSEYAAFTAYIGKRAQIAASTYIEHSYVLDNSSVGERSIVSNVKLRDNVIPDETVVHGQRLADRRFVVRTYGVADNPKGRFEQGTSFLRGTLDSFIAQNKLEKTDLWDDNDDYLWFARLYPACETMEEALEFAQIVQKMSNDSATCDEVAKWKSADRMSLYSSFNKADVMWAFSWQLELENKVLASRFVDLLMDGLYYEKAIKTFGERGLTEGIFNELMKDADNSDFSVKIRIYYAVSRMMRKNHLSFGAFRYDDIENLCFATISNTIYKDAVSRLVPCTDAIVTDRVDVQLPVRVNWGGGWTDTPPYCLENGGVVLNAAIKLNGILPVQVTVKRLDKPHVEFESVDVGSFGVVESVEEIQDCNNPYDLFALHKAALIACGIIPISGKADLQEILKKLGGGIYLSTQVVGVPKGSGLGTSSILSGACVKGLYQFMGTTLSDSQLYDIVLCMEQIMSTGGGWQDQVGGLTGGIKFITTSAGIKQNIVVKKVCISDETKAELQERFALIYTGQRRLARNLLRDVVGNYIGARPQSVEALSEMREIAALMKFELEQGRVDNFAKKLNMHWKLSTMLDGGSTNTCIDQMLMACDDLIDGKFISGAGGGGFLQVILKKGVTKSQLSERLHEIFQDSGVDVWDSEFIFD